MQAYNVPKFSLDEIYDAYEKAGTIDGAARELGYKQCTGAFRRRCKLAMVKKGSDPKILSTVPLGHEITGVTTYVDADGNIERQWIKTKTNKEFLSDLMEEITDGFVSELPRCKPFPPIATVNSDICNLFPVFDAHFGMLAWDEECGENYDLKIAEDLFTRWFQKAVVMCPVGHTAILLLGGDLFHWDGLEAVTPTHRNILDPDSRFAKVVRTVIRVIRRIVELLLRSHKEVQIIVIEGNHDPASSIQLREWLLAFYESVNNVIVDTTLDLYSAFEWGLTSMFFHHGHKKGPKDDKSTAMTFAAKFRELFGRTKYSYAHTGDKHHHWLIENSLMTIEQHPTLAAKDAFATRGGWMSNRSASVISYSKKYGEVGRITISPQMVYNEKEAA